jgi:hypothetical protein
VGLYRTQNGRAVLHIQYKSSWEGEAESSTVVMFEGFPVAQIETALMQYDPVEHLIGYPPGEAHAEKQERLVADLRQRYRALVSEVLNGETFAENI